MKFGVVNKSTMLNRFVLHTLQRNITHLAAIARKSNIKLGILKGGKLEKSRDFVTQETLLVEGQKSQSHRYSVFE